MMAKVSELFVEIWASLHRISNGDRIGECTSTVKFKIDGPLSPKTSLLVN